MCCTSEITFAIEGNNKTINGGIMLYGANLTLDNVKYIRRLLITV